MGKQDVQTCRRRLFQEKGRACAKILRTPEECQEGSVVGAEKDSRRGRSEK